MYSNPLITKYSSLSFFFFLIAEHFEATCHPHETAYTCLSAQVSKKALWLLKQVEQEPLLNLEQLNPELVAHTESMGQAHEQRQKLCLLGEYLHTCRSGAYKKLQARCLAECLGNNNKLL